MADTLEPLYKLIHQGLLQTGNLQADETPVRYLNPGKGKTSTGYFWVIHGPRCGIKGELLALRQRPEVLPKSRLGRAIDYTLILWDRLLLYMDRGEIEIDNNLTENGIRPTTVGKKNWLFVGSETTGQRAAIIDTMLECAKRHGHNPEAWLTDVLERLPAMTNQDNLSVQLPSIWQPAAAATAPLRETCPA